MSAYTLETVLQKWEKGTLTTEQAVGQILLLLQNMAARIGRLEVQQVEARRVGKPVDDGSGSG